MEIVFVLAVLAILIVAFFMEWRPPGISAMAAASIFLAAGVIGAEDVRDALSNSALITVGCMFVLSTALERTGWIETLGFALERLGRGSPLMTLFALMLLVMLASAAVNNTPVVLVLMPVVIILARRQKMAPSLLLIPLSYAAIFGGGLTIIGTSTNLLVDGVAQSHGLPAFSMFDITMTGLVFAAVGIVYMLLIGKHLLPDRPMLDSLYNTTRYFHTEVLIPQKSYLIGKSPTNARLTRSPGAMIIDVIRDNQTLRHKLSQVQLHAGDRIVIRTDGAGIKELNEDIRVRFSRESGEHDLEPIAEREADVLEGMVGPHSRFVGRRIADLGLRRFYGVYIIALHRSETRFSEVLEQVELDCGDTLLIQGPREGIHRLFHDGELINLSEPRELPVRRHKAPVALIALLSVIVIAALTSIPVVSLALIAAIVVVLVGCLTPKEAFDGMDWGVLMLIWGMIAVGKAVENSGSLAWIAEHTLIRLGQSNPAIALSGLYLLTSLLTAFLSNNATALLLTPMAIGMAQHLGLDPTPFLVAVMFAASASFATPLGYQTNLFVYSAGGYYFHDFVKVGLPLNIIFWLVASFLIPWLWPLKAL